MEIAEAKMVRWRENIAENILRQERRRMKGRTRKLQINGNFDPFIRILLVIDTEHRSGL